MNKSLSDSDIRRRLPGVPIYKYSDLSKLTTFPPEAVVLLEWEKSGGVGHWVALFHQGDKPYYFNSFGQKFDSDLNCISRAARVILGEEGNQIERLLNGAPCDWNKTKFQSDTSSVCGRYCINRIRDKDLSSGAYLKTMNKLKKEYGSYDSAILELVP